MIGFETSLGGFVVLFFWTWINACVLIWHWQMAKLTTHQNKSSQNFILQEWNLVSFEMSMWEWRKSKRIPWLKLFCLYNKLFNCVQSERLFYGRLMYLWVEGLKSQSDGGYYLFISVHFLKIISSNSNLFRMNFWKVWHSGWKWNYYKKL
jgi:hypothetical protein